MGDEETKIINKPQSFEEKVLAQFETISLRLDGLEKQATERDTNTQNQVLQVLEEFRNMKETVTSYLGNFDEKLNVINSELLGVKAEQRKIANRIKKLETENLPQVVTQEGGF